jgi:hypothetical protein
LALWVTVNLIVTSDPLETPVGASMDTEALSAKAVPANVKITIKIGIKDNPVL